MMRHGLLLLLTLLALVPAPASRAQVQADSLALLRIGIWPDYDRPAVLVILTGTLRSSAPLPAVVKVPIPADATMNAVARIDANGNMIADIVYTQDAGQLTLATPDPNFRVEYYVPYRVEGENRGFLFAWRADLSVDTVEAMVQRPVAASSLVTEPAAVRVMRGVDGLDYHILSERAVPAGESFEVKAAYPNFSAPLSLETLRAQSPNVPGAPTGPPPGSATPAPAPVAPAASGGSRWDLVIVAIVAAGLAAGLTWQIARSRADGDSDEVDGVETPPRAETLLDSCPECGRRNESGDRFCSRCGGGLVAEG